MRSPLVTCKIKFHPELVVVTPVVWRSQRKNSQHGANHIQRELLIAKLMDCDKNSGLSNPTHDKEDIRSEAPMSAAECELLTVKGKYKEFLKQAEVEQAEALARAKLAEQWRKEMDEGYEKRLQRN
ncbi:hypothetical protein COCNU_09G003150 [Cocos nucifera]|uniref:Uncharacterized protein n=1 Tax=Cocos nucifera TaxID=13894 RepID=A0A8K0IJH5_COCNU|nr:hypothetical protein COCNU_09G003150 [Cocos nucifera]